MGAEYFTPHNKVTLFSSQCKSESRGQFDEILSAT